MATMRARERALFTATEWALIEASEPSRVRAFTPGQLKDRIKRARRFWDKYRELGRQQQRRTKKRPQPGRAQPFSNLRTRRKAHAFAGALERFEKRLEQQKKEEERRSHPQRKRISKRSRRPLAQREAIRREKQQRQAANEAALAPRVARQFQKSQLRAIQGHVRASGTRRQAKRDAR